MAGATPPLVTPAAFRLVGGSGATRGRWSFGVVHHLHQRVMLFGMRATISFDDRIFEVVKRRAAAETRSLREFIATVVDNVTRSHRWADWRRLAWITGLVLLHSAGLPAQGWETSTYRLTESTAELELWTIPPSERVFGDHPVPTASDSGLRVYAARNEVEPVQLVVRPAASGPVTVSIGSFGPAIDVDLFEVRTVDVTVPSDFLGRTGPNPDPLWPLDSGDSVAMEAGQNTALWISVQVGAAAAPGDHSTVVVVGGVAVPLTLHVFDFAIPDTLHVESLMYLSSQAILNAYGVPGFASEYWEYVDRIKQLMIDHRLTPASVLWPGGVTGGGAAPFVDYDCAGTLSDPYGIWGFEAPAARWLDGSGLLGGQFATPFNDGAGFPSFMAATFMNNDASADQRPASFCGQTRSASDWYTGDNPTSAYNQEWFEYLDGLQVYLDGLGELDRAYYYFANEPQDQADYDAVAWYSRYVGQAAPGLNLMVSEQPRSEIFDHADYVGDGQVDIWLAVLHELDPVVSGERALNHGEASWIYFLYGTRPPFFNPITLDHPGLEARLTGWFLWRYRLEGIAYYALNDWSTNPWTNPSNGAQNGDVFMLYPPSVDNVPIPYGSNGHRFVPSTRLELLRDGLEDYEYLWLLNGGAAPVVGQSNPADLQADQVIGGVAAFARSSEFVSNLRRLIGLRIGGEISSIPDIDPPIEHPRSQGPPAALYVNFQDPLAEPATTFTQDTWGTGYVHRYVTYAGHDYLQVGTEQYAAAAGLGWRDDTTHFMTFRDPWGSETDERMITSVYDDYADNPAVFEIDIPNGNYVVTVAVGTPRTERLHNRVIVEGVTFIDDEPSSMFLVRSAQVTVDDRRLTLETGLRDEYTMLDYLDIVPVDEGLIFADGFESGSTSAWSTPAP